MGIDIRIAVVGDYNPDFPPHQATNEAFGHAAAALSLCEKVTWIPTEELANGAEILQRYAGLHVAPGSPYRSMSGALNAITFARENALPLLASCGGCQHVVIEYARRVLRIADAEHAEYDPYASNLFVTELECSLVGKQMEVQLSEGSLTRRLHGSSTSLEQYYCNFGLSPQAESALSAGLLRTVGRDAEGEVRILELASHPFFIATLFVPGLSSSETHPHPLIVGFLEKSVQHSQSVRVQQC